MLPLSSDALLAVWEDGVRLHGVDRALLVLSRACPEHDHDTLAGMSLGRRDALLIAVRRQSFGDRMDASTACPSCREYLELSLSCASLLAGSAPGAHDEPSATDTIAIDGYELVLRAPDSYDAAIAAGCSSVEEAAAILFERSVRLGEPRRSSRRRSRERRRERAALDGEAAATPPFERSDSVERAALHGKAAAATTFDRSASRTDPAEPNGAELPAEVRRAATERLAAMDPHAEIRLDLSCPGCGHAWQDLLDVAPFVWAEICSRAQRLLQEVHELARYYGWSEQDILGMSVTRRTLYLQRVES